MAPHTAVDVAAGHEPARVSADPSRRLDAPEQKTPPRSSRPRAVTDATGGTPIAAMHAALDSHPLARRSRPWQTWVPRLSRHGDVAAHFNSTPRDVPDVPTRKRKTLRTYRALVRKNALLKTRGAALLCFALELLIPVAFVLLMCLPRALVSDRTVPAMFHRVSPIESLAWSRKPPSARAVRVIYSPRTPAAVAVAEAAGVTLVCGPDVVEDTGRFANTHAGTDARENLGTESPEETIFASFAQQAAAAAALDVDLAAVLAGARDSNPLGSVGPNPSGGGSLDVFTNSIDPDLMQSCVADPVACASSAASAVRLRPDPPIALDSPLFAAPAKLRAEFCVASCVDDATCRRRVLDEFLLGVDTAEEAEALALGRSANVSAKMFPRQPAMAVVLLPPDLAPRARRVEYVIRVNASDTPTGASGPAWAEEKLVRWVVGEDDKWREYWTYVNVQRAFDQALLSLALARDEDPDAFSFSGRSDAFFSEGTETETALPLPRGARLDVRVKSYPFPAYSTNLGSTYAAVFFGLAFVFAFVVAAASMCQSVVLEKELRLREGMEIMGMSRSAYWGSWFTTSYASLLLVSFLVSAIGSYPFKHTDWTVTFIFLTVWSAQLTAFCFFLSACFRDAKVAAVAGALFYVLTWTPGIAAAASTPEGSSVWLACTAMMPASGVYMWGWAVAILENAQRGARWDTLFRNLLADDEADDSASGTFSAGGVLVIALANALVYGALAWAVDVGATPSNALKQTKAFFAAFARKRTRTESAAETRTTRPSRFGDAWDVAALSDGLERDRFPTPSDGKFPHAATPAVRVANVSKTFGNTHALDGMSFAARRGEITAVLGHNGAGKSTALSLLTGALRNFEGDAFVDGVDVKKYPERARASLGVCPQFDVLWPSLTVREHLELFAAFRPLEGSRGGQKEKSVDARVAASLAAVGLARDADRTAGTLSGGQRRKLSLAIAFIGEPSVVLLDEPTAGMDPVSRRHAWDVIRGLAGRRGGEGRNGGAGETDTEKETDAPVSVLLTTHFMDEADALSDRVAVVHSGKLACAGSPLFVKTAFGGGYVLRLRVSRDADLDAVKRVVRRARDEGSETTNETASFVERSGANDSRVLTFALPCTSKAVFPELLEALEGLNGEAIGVLECGVGCATLEDAFLNVADLADGIQKLPTEKKQDATKTRENASARKTPPERDAVSSTTSRKKRRKTKTATFIAQTRATFWKRAVHCRRTFMSTVAGTFLAPLLFAAAGLAASSAAARRAGDPRPASMLDLSFLGNAPIGVASSAGRHAFVSGTALSTKADPSDVVALAGDAARTLLADGVVAPFAGVDKLWDCSADSLVLDACAHTCPSCGPRETALLPTDTLETALVEKLASSVARREFYETVSSTGSTNRSGTTPTFLFDAFASLDGALLANAKPRATCAFGRHSFMSTCASLFVEPGAMDTSRPIPRNEPRRFAYTVLTSSTAYHALPAAMAVAHDAIFRTILGSGKTETMDADDLNARASSSSSSLSSNGNGSLSELPSDREEEVSLVSINHPLPSTETEKQEKALLSRLLVSLCVVVSLSALSASAAAPFPAREMNTGAKHLQIVSGMRRDAYWCGTFAWDVCLQTPTLAATLLLLTAGGIAGAEEQNENDDHSSRFLALVVALALFVVSATPLVYVIGSSVKFASPAAAVASTLALFVFFGVAQLIAAVTLGGLAGAGAAGPAATNAWRACRFIFLWLPHYCVGRVVFDASGGFGDASAWASDAGVETFSSSHLDEKNESGARSFRIPATSTEALIAMGTGAVVYASLALLLERAEEKRNASSSSFSLGRRPKRVWTEIVSRLRGETTSSVSEATDDLERGEVNRSPRRSSGGLARKGSSRPAHAPFANDSVRSFETDTVVSSRLGNAALVVRGLRKKFRGKPPVSDQPLPLGSPHLRHKKEEKRRFAVDDVTFDVARGESFALLGVNGAGKTTTFEMLTGALAPTTGDAYVVSKNDGDDSDEGDDSNDEAEQKKRSRFLSLRRDADAFRRAVGYCPQRDALFESLSAREHLLFYGALRGLSSEESADAAARVCDAVGLRGALVTRPAREYSGGNKRALAVAIALMGDPACVLLDEPSTGMDPRARRKLWRALDAASKLSGVAFVLTSHSMEEAEAVCGRAGLVEAGTLRHVGDVDAWRAALGTGHALEMRLRDASPKRRQAVAEFVRETFRVPTKTKTETSSRGGVLDGVDLFDAERVVVFSDDARLGRLMKCRVPQCVPLSFVFRQVELHRDALGVEEYQVGAATLEETFLRFASRADDERAMRLS